MKESRYEGVPITALSVDALIRLATGREGWLRLEPGETRDDVDRMRAIAARLAKEKGV